MVQARPSISVVIPVQEGMANNLARAIDSALAQTTEDLEVVVVVDDPEHDAGKIALAMSEQDPRIRVVKRESSSAGAEGGRGALAATGTYVSFLDPNDCYPDENVLQDLLQTLEESGLRIAAGNYHVASDSAVPRASDIAVDDIPRVSHQYPFSQDSIVSYADCQVDYGFHQFLIERELLAANDLALPGSHNFQENLFVVRILDTASVFVALKRVTYTYRTTAETPWSLDDALNRLEAMIEVLHIARRRGYQSLRERTLTRFQVAEMQQAIRLTIETDAERTLRLLEKMARIALEREAESSSEARALRDPWQRPEGQQSHLGATQGVSRTTGADVSIVIPVYNAAAWLHECLLSVLGQSRVSTQIICVNDGSSDDSMRILQGYRALHPHRIQVIDQTNGGLSAARNTGLNAATGRYVCLLDSDDYWRLDALYSLVSRADSQNLDVLQFDTIPFRYGDVEAGVWATFSRYYARPGQPTVVLSGEELLSTQRKSSDYKPNAGLYMIRNDYLAELGLRFIPGIMHEDNPFTFSVMLNARRAAHEAIDFHARRVRSDSIMNSSSVERSMRGYFVSYLHMREEAARHSFDLEIAKTIGLTLYGIFNNVSTRLEQVDDAVAERLADLVSTADAQQTYSVLMRLRTQSRGCNR